MVRHILLPLVLSLVGASFLHAQPTSGPVELDNLPSATSNHRFFLDRFPVTHPSLTANGFDCQPNCAHGLGLKQILEHAYQEDARVLPVYKKVLAQAQGAPRVEPDSRWDYTWNSMRAEARAFVALVTYVLERNGADFEQLNQITAPEQLPSHNVALEWLRQSLLDGPPDLIPSVSQIKAQRLGADAVKWTTALMHWARAVDLYLALENAYRHYADPDSSVLLSQSEKQALMRQYAAATDHVDDLGNQDVWHITGIKEDEVQPGNWPMKVHVAVGYAALMQQRVGARHPYAHWVRRALRSAGQPTRQNRSNHWHYQTDGGRRVWAEGPYYLQWALREIVPFWHAMRINGLLDYHPEFTATDPFHSAWFTHPLHWLADLVTPDGRTPPLDDGNKQPMRNSSVLRWTSAYGADSLGRKFAWINDRPGLGVGSSLHLYLVELAIPRVKTEDGVAPRAHVGNHLAEGTDDSSEQQLVVRRQDERGRTHYVLLNGEQHNAIARGEGHEQPDNMQLLYYVDDATYLMDSGYDAAPSVRNSTWNHYADHNVMHFASHPNDKGCGLRSPRVNYFKHRMVSSHKAIQDLYQTQYGAVTALHARQQLRCDGKDRRGAYQRTVLVVGGQRPYLIDLNRMDGPGIESAVRMSYHANSENAELHRRDEIEPFVGWQQVRDGGAGLYLYPFSAASSFRQMSDPPSIQIRPDNAREQYGAKHEVPIRRVDVSLPSKGTADQMPAPVRMGAVLLVDEEPPQHPLYPIWSSSSNQSRLHQGWVWKQAEDVYDVWVVRDEDDGSPLRVDLQRSGSGAPPVQLELARGEAFGFARIQYDAEEWHVNPEYRVHLAPVETDLHAGADEESTEGHTGSQ